MSETLMTIIAIFAATIIMFIFPLMWTASSQEEITQIAVQTLVSDFVNTASTKGKVTKEDYEGFVKKLNATGNTYDVEIEIQILDDNPGKKTTMTSKNLIGENIYYSVFTSTILYGTDGIGIYDSGNTKNEYLLKAGDYIIVTVKNTNTTIATQLKDTFYGMVGKDTYTIGASATALVINSGAKQ